MPTSEIYATCEAHVDSLSDLGAAIDALPGDVDTDELCAAMMAASRSFHRLLTLLDGDA